MNSAGWFPVHAESQVAVGVDVGYASDNSVAVSVERLRLPMDPSISGAVDTQTLKQKLAPPLYIVRGIMIFALRTPFGHVIEHLKRIRAVLGLDVEFLVDCTGALAFAEMAREAGLSFTQLAITGGNFDQVSFRSGKQSVSKAGLVAQVDAALCGGELIIPADLPGAETLTAQLGAFQMGRSPISGQPVWGGARSKDDTVLALSYALFSLRARRGFGATVQPIPWL
jgi:hypothetical protein